LRRADRRDIAARAAADDEDVVRISQPSVSRRKRQQL
jgi:hypothetical protein